MSGKGRAGKGGKEKGGKGGAKAKLKAGVKAVGALRPRPLRFVRRLSLLCRRRLEQGRVS